MSDSAELRRIFGAMTERPWKWSAQHRLEGPEHTVDYGCDSRVVRDTIIETDCGYYPPEEPDREAIATLANHADALVKLVEACEAESAVLASFAARNGASYANTAKSIERVLGALAAVHATKVTP